MVERYCLLLLVNAWVSVLQLFEKKYMMLSPGLNFEIYYCYFLFMGIH